MAVIAKPTAPALQHRGANDERGATTRPRVQRTLTDCECSKGCFRGRAIFRACHVPSKPAPTELSVSYAHASITSPPAHHAKCKLNKHKSYKNAIMPYAFRLAISPSSKDVGWHVRARQLLTRRRWVELLSIRIRHGDIRHFSSSVGRGLLTGRWAAARFASGFGEGTHRFAPFTPQSSLRRLYTKGLPNQRLKEKKRSSYGRFTTSASDLG
eukprot:364818-Chlamydomonas_euryale.AAC.38